MNTKQTLEELWDSTNGKTMGEILELRDQYPIESTEWSLLNERKADLLEARKPSTKEMIVYFPIQEVMSLPKGFYKINKIPHIQALVERRSLLEYNSTQRHPIPYVVVHYKNQYFFVIRELGSGEERLIGKIGMLGGHITANEMDELSLQQTIINGLKREIHEEAGIMDSMVEDVRLLGVIHSDEGVDADHLGFVYQIELNTNQIKSEEEGVLTGLWIYEDDLPSYVNRMESWSKIVYDHVFTK